MADDRFEQALTRYVAAGGACDPEHEMARFRALPPEQRELIEARIGALIEYLSLRRPSVDDADIVAGRLGTKRRNLYRILARMREFGPIIALTPNARSKVAPSKSAAGLDPIAEKALSEMLRAQPDAGLRRVMSAITEAYAAAGSEGKPPSESTVRRRLIVLRGAGGLPGGGWDASREFGRRVLVDHSAVASKAHGIDANLALTFIVDIETRLVIGCGHAELGDQASGLSAAVQHARERDDLVIGAFGVAKAPRHIEWIVSDDLLRYESEWGPDAARGDTVATVTAIEPVTTGARRHGQRLVRLLGAQFDTFTLMPRVLAEGRRRGAHSRLQSREDISVEVRGAVWRWNYRVLEAASALEPTLDERERRARLDGWRKLQSNREVRRILKLVLNPFDRVLRLAAQDEQGA